MAVLSISARVVNPNPKGPNPKGSNPTSRSAVLRGAGASVAGWFAPKAKAEESEYIQGLLKKTEENKERRKMEIRTWGGMVIWKGREGA